MDRPTIAPPPELEHSLCARFVAAVQSAAVDERLAWRARTLGVRCLIQIGSTAYLLCIDQGRVVDCQVPARPLCSWSFALRGSLPAWSALWEAVPAPGWHDLFALSKRGELTIEGDLQPFMAHLQYFKDLLSLPRESCRP